MCNLYSMTATVDELRHVFGPFAGDRDNVPPFDNIYPGHKAPLFRRDKGGLALDMMTWGFPGPQAAGGRPVTNVRNLASPFWRSAFQDPSPAVGNIPALNPMALNGKLTVLRFAEAHTFGGFMLVPWCHFGRHSHTRKVVLLSITACAAAFAATPAVAQTINLDATQSAGDSVSLGAGTYQLSLIGTADGGSYNGWNPWGSTTCTAPASNCAGWTDLFAINYGGKITWVNDNLFYPTATDALAGYQAAIAGNTSPFNPYNQTGITNTGGTLFFTLLTPTSVTFRLPDTYYADNSGGVSLSLSAVNGAVPEPAAWALMLLGFGAIGVSVRRSKTAAARRLSGYVRSSVEENPRLNSSGKARINV